MKWTIRRKFLLGFLCLFSFAILVFNQLLEKTIENNTANFIKNTTFLFIGVFMISLFLTHRIIKPLQSLTKAAKLMGRGDYTEITNKKTSDEIGELARQFQQMQNEIRLHIEKISEEKEKVLLLERKRTDFFNNVTYELKTPLTTISGYAQIISEKGFDDALFLQKASAKIQSESERLNDMVTQLLSFSKLQMSGVVKNKEVFDLFPLIQSIREDMQLKANKYAMTIELKGKPFFIYAYRNDMRQVIINLIDNAIKHGKENHPIRILVDQTVTITNDCEPVPTKIIDQAFEPFIHHHAKDSHGLGLFICKQIIEQYNRNISFQNDSGKAIIKVHLPRWQQNGNNSSQTSNRSIL